MTPDTRYKKVFTTSKTLAGELVKVTYADLVDMVTNSQLVPGQKYRIIDYAPNMSDNYGISSANHIFDIVTMALSENVLSEDCRAMVNDDDDSGYFATSNLEAWDIKYTINPDDRYASYNPVGGKGYIYQMTDDHYNTAACDFKNRLFEGKYMFSKKIDNEGTITYEDASLNSYCYGNTVNVGWAQYEKYLCPKCTLVLTGTGYSLRNNTITAWSVYIEANAIDNNTISERMQSAGGINVSSGTPLKAFHNCNVRISGTGILRITTTNSDIDMLNCDFDIYHLGVSTGREIALGASINSCKFILKGELQSLDISNWGIGSTQGVLIETCTTAGNAPAIIVSALTPTAYEISIGTWNSGNSSYDWVDKSITL